MGLKVGRLQLLCLQTLANSSGLSCSDLARILVRDRGDVYYALKALAKRGLVESFPYHIDFYGRYSIHAQPIRLYVLTDEGKRFLEKGGGQRPSERKEERRFIRYDEFMRWGLEGALVSVACRHLWDGFRKARKRRGLQP